MSVLTLNINSLVGHVLQLLDLVSDVKPHIIVLVETWLKPNIDNCIFGIDGYEVFRTDCNLIHKDTGRFMQGGGEACIVHKSLKAQVLHISASDDINPPEFMILDVILSTGSHLLVSCVH